MRTRPTLFGCVSVLLVAACSGLPSVRSTPSTPVMGGTPSAPLASATVGSPSATTTVSPSSTTPAPATPAVSPIVGGSPAPSESAAAAPSPSATASTPASPTSQPPFVAPIVLKGSFAPLLSSGDRSRRVIALTIDDCLSDSAVETDFAILEANHINATWFPIGRWVEASPALWRSIAEAGFPIANHTQDHPILTRLSYEAVLDEIRTDNERVSAIIGEPLVPFLRPPGGAWSAAVLAAAAAAGERAVVLWDTTDGDTGRPYDDIPLLEWNAEHGRNGSILLMHANLPYAQQALPAIIAWYRARGFTFVTLGQLFGIPGPVPFPESSATPTPSPSGTATAHPS